MDHLAHAGSFGGSLIQALCFGPDGAPSLLGLAGALFLTGLVGGLTHCGPMCSPFVLAQLPRTAPTAPGGLVLARLRGGLLLPYHAGRMITYAALGAVAGGFGGVITVITELRWLLAAFLLAAAALFAWECARRLLPQRDLPSSGQPAATTGRIGGGIARWGLTAALAMPDRRRTWRGLLCGLALGFLPCGFLYAALVAATAGGSAVAGAAAMAAFALGTVPSLAIVGCAGLVAAGAWRRFADRLAAPLFATNAITLLVIAIGTLG